jgi:hypothetical protein
MNREYKKKITALLECIDDEQYLKYLYILMYEMVKKSKLAESEV